MDSFPVNPPIDALMLIETRSSHSMVSRTILDLQLILCASVDNRVPGH